jgi:ADP-ribose pyrophosphatase YjhB (NUDIX family)
MIPFDTELTQYAYWVAGISIYDRHILLQNKDGFWIPPGGSVEPRESARDALKRAMHQIMDADISIGQLMWVSENIADCFGETDYEMAFYFQLIFHPALLCFPRDTPIIWETDLGQKIILRWIPLNKLDSLKLAPSCLVQEIDAFAEEIEFLEFESRYTLSLLSVAVGEKATVVQR